MNQLVEKISRRARNRLKFYDGATPIFEALGIQNNRRRVSSAGLAALWRLHRDRRDRSAGGGGRKPPKQSGRDVEEDDLANQFGGGGRNRAAIALP